MKPPIRPRIALVLLPCMLAAAVGAAALIVRSRRPSGYSPPPAHGVRPAPKADAREIRQFQESHRKEIDSHLKNSIKVDPTLSGSILSVDEKFVQSIEGLDEVQKKEIWRALKSAQDDIKKRGGQ